jgi:hypothetical protein
MKNQSFLFFMPECRQSYSKLTLIEPRKCKRALLFLVNHHRGFPASNQQ